MSAVVLDSVSKVYPGGQRAVADLSLEIADGEFFVLLGPSGCGKSTTLRMVAGLEEITTGGLWLDGRLANELTPRERNVAMVFQNGALYPHRTVRDNIGFPLEIARADQAEASARVVEMARALGIDPTLDRLPGTLSGGQRQRVAMGRAIIREPAVFLMDEPLSNLDAALRTDLRVEIGGLVRGLGVTTLYVTHDQVEALTLADRIAVLRDGFLEDVGTPPQIYESPATAFVAGFLGAPQINLLAAVPEAVPGEGVVLHLGTQRLVIPWTDPRAEHVAGHHAATVILGIRSDALRPTGDPHLGPVLSGGIRTLEYHGHEWLAHIDAGVTVVDAAEVGRRVRPEPAAAGRSSGGMAGRALSLLRGGRREAAGPEPAPHVGSHRRAELLARLHSRDGYGQGSHVHLAVDLERVLIFGRDGHRVDPVLR
ncbi:multiple sugar transport system ATP-binding protein [Thermomonospora echinospora]|uniref:Multiple sugar transport system ATP-binding protein n=1 Tax=Thermomonospora echinospora TaxID=1992 RepID=A0A1H5XGT8_9ACTN|nr:ATP-binding cassette domain-containing protein [Thermomonospora echinospora]SEG10843.1 multiple sugar transport system ATP-binding protein [Thermomonospora echinospora]